MTNLSAMANLPINKHEVILTGVSEKKASKHGGSYRYIFAIGPDGYNLHPSSLSDTMANFDDWDLIIKLLEQRKKLLCSQAVLISKGGKTMVDCDFVPHVLEIVEIDEQKRKEIQNAN